MIFALLVITGLAWYFMNAGERTRLLRGALSALKQVTATAVRVRGQQDDVLNQTLRERTPWPIVTPVLALLNVAVFAWMHLDPSAAGTDLLGNFGPRTTNGEWWRLLTAAFVHTGVIHLVVNTVALVQVGLVLERLVGYTTFTGVYVAAAVFANLTSLSMAPLSVIAGASGAIFGLYGLLIALWMWGTFQHVATTVRLRTVRRLAPAAAACTLFNLFDNDIVLAAECAGLVTGFGCGLLTARFAAVRKPSVRRVATTMAAFTYVAIMAAVPLRGLSDVRPALAEVLAVEQRTTAMYDAAVEKFRNGRMDAHTLAQMIEDQVVPELQAARKRLLEFDRTPTEHAPIVAAAEVYTLRRNESWQLRARALRKADMRLLRDADKVERASLDAFLKFKQLLTPNS